MSDDHGIVDPTRIVVVVLGGGRGTRLYPLTKDRAKPAVGFGGKYRLIDIPLTNCLRSKFQKVFILTQFNSFSLNRHIWQTYSHVVREDGFIDVIAAEQTAENADWFQGTADAVRQSLRHILQHDPSHVLIISADQLYCMDYRQMLLWHNRQSADVTIAAHYTGQHELHRLGVIGVQPDMRVVGFCEKPETVDSVRDMSLANLPGVAGPPDRPWLCSMGIYLFNTATLLQSLDGDEEDFGKSVIPLAARRNRMVCFPFEGYWEDVGTIQAFYEANMDWRAGKGVAEFFEHGNAIITRWRQLPPSRLDGTRVDASIIADGCTVRAGRVDRCIIGVRERIAEGCVLEDSILMGNDAYRENVAFEIGKNCVIRKAILDKNVVVGEGARIERRDDRPDGDEPLYSVRSGIVVIPRGTVIPPGTII